MTRRDWVEWHRNYDDPDSRQSWRLRIVRRRISQTLDALPGGEVRVASLCAGDGRDLLGVLEGHARAADVVALLVELDPEPAARARARASSTPAQVRVVTGDAAATDTYAAVVPVDLLLVCGVFGNIADEDVAATIRALPGFCRRGTEVVWTRHRRPPDLVPTVLDWFAGAGFTALSVDDAADHAVCVGHCRYEGDGGRLAPGERLFTFR
jgi:SAM-dependent methyltransferase